MKKQFVLLLTLLSLLASAVLAQTPSAPKAKTPAPKVCSQCIRAHEEFLASDAMRGRGSGTEDEHKAADYVASQLKSYGIAPAGDNGGYIQQATIVESKLTGPPTLRFMTPGDGIPARQITWTYGKDFLVVYLTQIQFTGPLQKIDLDQTAPKSAAVPKTGAATTGATKTAAAATKAAPAVPKVTPGAVVLLVSNDKSKLRKAAFAASATAAGVLIAASDDTPARFAEAGKKLPTVPARLEGSTGGEMGGNFNVIELNGEAMKELDQIPAQTKMIFEAPAKEEKGHTWNAVGILRGRNAALQHAAVLLSAHLDHLGVGKAVNGDEIYNGADDDASGTTAVLELARVLGAGPRPRRTVIFALFGSEETGGLGSTYFREHPPLPLKEIAVNLEFEMIGRPDPKVKTDTLWLTGWERSNLGPTLAAHGAKLVGDPHPDQQFFKRSDNYVLAKKGVVAQTVSSYGLHGDYHQPSDDVAHLNFKHMDAAIGSLLGPIEWLVNSDFKPAWVKGGKP